MKEAESDVSSVSFAVLEVGDSDCSLSDFAKEYCMKDG